MEVASGKKVHCSLDFDRIGVVNRSKGKLKGAHRQTAPSKGSGKPSLEEAYQQLAQQHHQPLANKVPVRCRDLLLQSAIWCMKG